MSVVVSRNNLGKEAPVGKEERWITVDQGSVIVLCVPREQQRKVDEAESAGKNTGKFECDAKELTEEASKHVRYATRENYDATNTHPLSPLASKSRNWQDPLS